MKTFDAVFMENLNVFSGGSRAAAISKMEHFVITVNGWKTLTIVTNCFIWDVAAAVDPPLLLINKNKTKSSNFFFSFTRRK